MRPKRKDQVIRFARLLLGLVFLAAAAAKGMDVTRFVRQTETILWTAGFPVAGWVETLSWFSSIIVLIIEFVVSATLISGWMARIGAGIGLGALVMFSCITIFAWLNKVEDSCGCFGALLPRSAQMAVLENFILLIPGILAIRSTKSLRSRPSTAILMMLVSIVWTGLFYYLPYPGSALRIGIKPNLPAEVVLPRNSRFFVWFFDPECTKCLDQLKLVQTITGGGPRLAGLTDATEGRLEEFNLDIRPGFQVVRITKDAYRTFGVHDGTLVEIKAGRVSRLWSGYSLKDETTALSVGS